jgi:hypothetical protein
MVNNSEPKVISSTPSRALSLSEYAAELAASGTPVYALSNTDFWVRYESWAAMRIPAFVTGPPSAETINAVLGCRRALVATYLLEPDAYHLSNASLYTCSDQEFSVDKLPKDRRQNVRRGSRELRIEPVTTAAVLAKGLQAFSDTRSRVGLTDGTAEIFDTRFSKRGRCSGHEFLGAWHNDDLVAFLSITAVDDWAEIEGGFSSTATRALRPNDTLVAAALTEYLVVRRCRVVSYGLSSIQAANNEAGLHEFKTKLGFVAKPVHRVFATHSLVEPFVNSVTHQGVRAMLSLVPGNRVLKKCDGVMSTILGKRTLA